MTKKEYNAPSMEMLEARVEKGFAGSNVFGSTDDHNAPITPGGTPGLPFGVAPTGDVYETTKFN